MRIPCHSEPCHTGLRSGINKKSVILDSESFGEIEFINLNYNLLRNFDNGKTLNQVQGDRGETESLESSSG
ncbi:MAG: hypothetical protein LBQ59_01635 [Candidatus Peribacteria bacterium]|jgi:hypothetical protein|nr:hypothetical protein [Candidatus Peribacteria bacterium]